MNDESTILKKVSPYPIEIKFSGAKVFQGKIIKLTLVGCLVELDAVVVNVQEDFEYEYVIPVYNKLIRGPLKVVKTYDHYQGSGGSGTQRLAEFHFSDLAEIQREYIRKFLLKIKQI